MWLFNSNRPPEFTIETQPAIRTGSDYRLPFKATNTGDGTAQQVRVEGVLAGGEAETASTVFDFLPGHGHVEGCLIFSSDPAKADVRVVSYQEP
jgi:uncharacterized protein (TIGR02588 family)